MVLNRRITTDAFHVKPLGASQTFLEIYKCIKPLHLIARYVGLFPVNIKRTGNQAFVRPENKVDWYYFGGFMLLYTVLTYYTIIIIENDEKKVFKISEPLLFVYFYTWALSIHLWIILAFSTRLFVTKGLKLLSETDSRFLKHGYWLDYYVTKKFSYKLIVTMTLSILIRSVVHLLTIKTDVLQQAALLIGAFLKSMTKYQYVVFIHLLKVRYRKVIEVIEGMEKNTRKVNSRFDKEVETSEARDKLYMICRMHFKLCNVLRTWNRSFAFLQLLSLFISLCNVLFHCYYLYYILAGRTDDEPLTLSQPILYLVDEAIEIYILIAVCEDTCDYANKTPIVLHELRNAISNMELEKQIQVYSLQLLHQKIEFSVLGFFEIDYSLIYSMIGAVTTYLVIFIQFDQSQQNRENAGSFLNSTEVSY